MGKKIQAARRETLSRFQKSEYHSARLMSKDKKGNT
jgi:hypothetical protein